MSKWTARLAAALEREKLEIPPAQAPTEPTQPSCNVDVPSVLSVSGAAPFREAAAHADMVLSVVSVTTPSAFREVRKDAGAVPSVLSVSAPGVFPATGPASRLFALSKEDGDRAHDVPWTETDFARCIGRITLFMKRGLAVGDAGDLAEQRHLRDIVLDERVSCIECSNYRPGTTRPCGNVRAAGVREVSPATATLLQRCVGFAPVLLPTDLNGVDPNGPWSGSCCK